MEVSGQLNSPATLVAVSTGWGPRAGLDAVERENILLLLGIEPQFLEGPDRSPSLYRLSYLRSLSPVYFFTNRHLKSLHYVPASSVLCYGTEVYVAKRR
jgi:hypothetical protein